MADPIRQYDENGSDDYASVFSLGSKAVPVCLFSLTMSKKRNDLSGCIVAMPTEKYSYDISVLDENCKILAGVHVCDKAKTSKKFAKAIAKAIAAAIPKA